LEFLDQTVSFEIELLFFCFANSQ